MIMKWLKPKHVPMDTYKVGPDFDPGHALAFNRESAPPAWLAVMLAIQDRIADATDLATNMATAKEPGYQAHCAGALGSLVELYDALERQRAEAMTENL
jgi:hypothetical protein